MDLPEIFSRATRWARERPDDPALLVGDRTGAVRPVTFGQVHQGTVRTAAALRRAGVAPRQRAVVMVREPYRLVVTVYGLLAAGAVPVFIDPGLSRAHLRACLDEVAPEAFVGEPAAQLARRVLGWGRGHVRTALLGGGSLPWLGRGLRIAVPGGSPAGGVADLAPPGVGADDLAAIAFTSGSTGVPKGVEYRYRTLAAQLDVAATAMELAPDAVLLSGFPPFALFGPVSGVTTVVPAIRYPGPSRTPGERVAGPLLAGRATVVGAAPAVLRVLADHCARHGLTLPSVERVYSFGAPLRDRLADDLRRVLRPGAAVLSVYGATECLPVSAIDAAEARTLRAGARGAHAGTCVGRPLPGVTVRVLPAGDPAEPGEIAVAGANVSPAYHGRPGATAAAKEPFAGGVLHRTGDLGRIDAEGRLWYLGRTAQRVVGAGFTLATEDVEAAADLVPGVARSALVGVGPPGGQRAVLCVELADRRSGRAVLRAVRAALDALPEGRRVGGLLVHPGFPTDVRHNAKIDRERLARWAARRGAA